MTLDAAAAGPYFYLPKMQSHLEARLWNSVFIDAQVPLQTTVLFAYILPGRCCFQAPVCEKITCSAATPYFLKQCAGVQQVETHLVPGCSMADAAVRLTPL